MPKTKHRSVSQINTYTTCPRKYKFSYVDEDIKIMRGSSAMSLGSAIHKAQEFNYKQKIKTKKDLSVDEINSHMLEFLVNEFKNHAENPGYFKLRYGKQETGESIMAKASDMLEVLYNEIMVNTMPLFVEMPITLNIMGQEFLQFIDLIDTDYMIRDLKTSASVYTEGHINRSSQLTGYALGFRTKFGRKEKGVQYDVITKTKIPKTQILKTTITDWNIARFLNTLEQVNKGIKNQIFPPVDNPMICGWCDFNELCNEDGGLPDADVLAKKLKEVTSVGEIGSIEKDMEETIKKVNKLKN